MRDMMMFVDTTVAFTAPALFLIGLHSPVEAAKDQYYSGGSACARDVTMVRPFWQMRRCVFDA
jgi:hypothetical protein